MSVVLFVSTVSYSDVPTGFGIFSTEETVIGDRADFSGGSIGSNGNIRVGSDAEVIGSVIAGGNITVYDRSTVFGDATAAGNISLGNSSQVTGTTVQHTTVPAYTINSKSVSTGTQNITVNHNQSLTLDPGSYRDVIVRDRAQLYLSSGVYNFKSLDIGSDGWVKFNISGDGVEINIQNGFILSDRAKMELVSGAAEDIVIYAGGSNEIRIGSNSKLYGSLTAPNAKVSVFSRAEVHGAIYARRVELQPDVFTGGLIENWITIDTDNDGVPDVVELEAGTDPFNPDDKPAVVVEGTFLNQTDDGLQKVKIDYTDFPGYEQCDAVPVSLDQGSVEGDLIPIPRLIDTSDVFRPEIDLTYKKDVAYHRITGSVALAKKMLYAFPVSAQKAGIPRECLKLYHFNEMTNSWEDVEIAYVTYRAVYAYVTSFSDYVVASKDYIYRVNPEYTDDDEAKKYSTISAAITEISTNAPDTQCMLLVAGSDQIEGSETEKGIIYREQNLYLPANVQMLGGLSKDIGDFDMTVTCQPKKYITILDGEAKNLSILNLSGSGLDQYVCSVEGFTFQNSAHDGGAVRLLSSGHLNSIVIRNCVFKNNTGNNAGALYLYNVSKLIVESCVFENNSALSYGSAVYCEQNPFCGVGATFVGCVFFNNSIDPSADTGATIFNNGSGPIENHIIERSKNRVLNCTFYNNSAPSGTDLASCIFRRDDDTYLMDIQNCIFFDNSGTDLVNCDDDPGVVSNSNNISTDPGFKDETSPEGADGIWGTADDGLQITKASVACINQGLHDVTESVMENVWQMVLIPEGDPDFDPSNPDKKRPEIAAITNQYRDACGRLRHSINVANRSVDIGAYELYYTIFPIGSETTIGYNNYSFLFKLKELAHEQGYLVNYVGNENYSPHPINSTEGWTIGTILEEDPDHLVTGTDDIQQFSIADNERTSGSTISTEYASSSNIISDIAILTLGSYDIAFRDDSPDNGTVLSEIQSVINGLSNVEEIFVTTDLKYDGPEEVMVENFNTHLISNPPTGVNQVIILPDVDITFGHYTNQSGYNSIAEVIWEKIWDYLDPSHP